ncbi:MULTISPECIES: prepilin-type N-terminal cleavage/methylation domain-containing protein [Aeromonas]|uniref:prepilin-type N-terminal cleavage/methylation domain-containing protein n=1 Tax=Aeromonas TaxID=642 RepID=UPI0018800317|nr:MULTISPECIES: prepilin-type N-terminal cleavage/methylation domain-containing protein [Aeromonas]MBE8735596.1 prepilin-type N-terminal cleavage/methylation domain-containing protein [Aeromonas veronii]MBE8740408.1 prepilin-type N-terminal cleavage/methylation domain-containing protein [Aeromonas veronii]MBE8744254.1 prepilin-type N-terminal cleavage/methylation domain-containing protein [Aeromonas veronii]MBE8764377.1 prepilin-type N-terminal cleavage/methylation domain-containing protein [A
MKKQAGFTLIELVIVIIILGILAVTAAPKFLNLQDDANEAAAQGVAAAIKSGAQLVYSRSAIDGTETSGASSVAVGTERVTTKFGYPTADDAGIGKTITVDGGWAQNNDGIYKSNQNNSCQVIYTAPSVAGATFSVSLSGANCS